MLMADTLVYAILTEIDIKNTSVSWADNLCSEVKQSNSVGSSKVISLI